MDRFTELLGETPLLLGRCPETFQVSIPLSMMVEF